VRGGSQECDEMVAAGTSSDQKTASRLCLGAQETPNVVLWTNLMLAGAVIRSARTAASGIHPDAVARPASTRSCQGLAAAPSNSTGWNPVALVLGKRQIGSTHRVSLPLEDPAKSKMVARSLHRLAGRTKAQRFALFGDGMAVSR